MSVESACHTQRIRNVSVVFLPRQLKLAVSREVFVAPTDLSSLVQAPMCVCVAVCVYVATIPNDSATKCQEFK